MTTGNFCHYVHKHANCICNLCYPVSSSDLKESDANGFVQKAISAANVYNNIVKYIDDANITSLTTLNLSQRAENVCCRTQPHLLQIPQTLFILPLIQLPVQCFRPSLGSMSNLGTC